MLLNVAYLLAWMLRERVVQQGQRLRLDWYSRRGLSFLQLGLRQLAALYDDKGLALIKDSLCLGTTLTLQKSAPSFSLELQTHYSEHHAQFL
jgi:hypothetical protein